jgi:MSHA biogenesis protein MshP
MSFYCKNQKGFSAMGAVIIIVFLALIGTYMASLSSISSLNTTQSLLSMQAWFAAKSGLDWAVHDAIQNAAGTLNCDAAGPTFTLSGGAASGFDIDVTCTTSTFVEAGICPNPSPCTTYALTVTADLGSPGDTIYASRTLTASVTNAP